MGLSYFWFIAAAVIGAMDLYFGNFFLLVISAAAFTTALFSFFFFLLPQFRLFTSRHLHRHFSFSDQLFDAFAASLERSRLLFRNSPPAHW